MGAHEKIITKGRRINKNPPEEKMLLLLKSENIMHEG